MNTFQIKCPTLINSIIEYIYKYKKNLKKYDKGNIIYLVNKLRGDNLKIGLGFGKYTFIFEDNEIYINYKEEGNPKGTECRVDYYIRFTLRCKNQEILEKFIKTCNEEKNEIEDVTNIHITNEYGEWYSYSKIPSRDIKSIYIDNQIKTKIISDIEHFLVSEKQYNKFGIPYKRTYLLTGPPGNGKTSLIKGLCKHLKRDLSMISISKKFDNDSLLISIKDLGKNNILLIEDIDSLFEKRVATNDNPSITFSNLINVLDGFLYKEGAIIFMTTNHPEKLDHALLRIGRIDMIFEINYPNKINIKQLFFDLLETKNEEQFNKFYENIKNKKISMSSIINFIFRYRDKWYQHIDELLKTDNFIKNVLNENKSNEFYT